MGGASERSISTAWDLAISLGRVQGIRPTGGNQDVLLPDMAKYVPIYNFGPFVLIIWNGSGSNSILLKDHTGTLIETIATGECAFVHLLPVSGHRRASSASMDDGFRWSVDIRTLLT